jgi:Transposase DDE domain.
MKNDFPNAPSYARFVTLSKRVAIKMMFFIKLGLVGTCTGISFVDSTCMPVCHNKRIYRNKVFKGLAERGKSTMGWYFGFKLHLLCNERGEILNFMFTKANVDDRNELVFREFEKDLFGKLYADKGYISQSLFQTLWNNGVHLVTGIRANMKNKLMPIMDKIMLRKRSVIETINDVLKNVAQLVHSRHRSIDGFVLNALSALSAYCFFEKKPSINVDFVTDETAVSLFC